jgi:hypothetical protein
MAHAFVPLALNKRVDKFPLLFEEINLIVNPIISSNAGGRVIDIVDVLLQFTM